MSCRTPDTASSSFSFKSRALTFFGRPSHAVLLESDFASRGPSTPSLSSVWASPLSLAATQGITFVFFSSGYLDVSVRRVLLFSLLAIDDSVLFQSRVSPFGYLRIFVPLQLPAAFRRLVRPSSSPSVQASSVRPSLLNHCFLLFNFSVIFSFRKDFCLFCYSVFKDPLVILSNSQN